jgi:RimJ/RimL family protein N-acetyltransferase
MTSLTTPRLVLRATDDTDAALVARLEQIPAVHRFIGQLGIASPDTVLLTVLSANTRIGQVGLVRSLAFDGSDYEFFCALLPEAEGCGFATEACQCLIDWAFTTKPLHRVLACVDETNIPSMGLVHRLKMTPLGPRPFRNETVYATFRPHGAT